ncbi:hypothetical protein [Paludisphaera mucosa]|uniref:DUF2185 domain-containing protein n=1 Tax=Paludisphaera mucosa TaxID=3030827 RepID=A0ABT6FK51_9BACT|nr:hypothetical protein [Paludisphaera mucosa]MDG3007958.1 hypothetical protein [Paludisphaera mucosa]
MSTPEAIPPWPFQDPPYAEVVTLDRIVRGASPILLVARDEDGWQFLDGEHVFEDDGEVVLLGEIVQLDPTLLDLADLDIGWHASRTDVGEPWERAEGEPG